MNRLHLADAVYCLDRAFDFDKAPYGGDFWRDIRARLVSYHAAPSEAEAPAANHKPIKFDPQAYTGTKFPSLHGNYAHACATAINKGLSWGACRESKAPGGNFWYFLHHTLLQMPGADERSRYVQYRPEGTYCTYTDEEACANTFGVEPALFIIEALGLNYRPGMFPQHAPDDKTMVRYIPADKPALEKNYITAKPGKFLAAFYGDVLSTTEIADIAAKHRAHGEPPKLQLARTADEIARIYRNGPSSCMAAGKAVDGIEPVRAYASPDFALAYAERKGTPTARCLVHPALKIYVRIYGDSAILKPLLEANGYTPARDPNGMIAPQLARLVGSRLIALPAPGVRPAKAALEQAGEPVLITPFFDLNLKAYFDPADGYLKLATTIPAGRTQHLMAGGHSIPAIPANGPPRPHETSTDHFYATIGASGNNSHQYLTYAEMGREEYHPRNRKATKKDAVISKAGTVTAANTFAVRFL